MLVIAEEQEKNIYQNEGLGRNRFECGCKMLKKMIAKRFWEVLYDYYIGMVSVKEKRRGPSKYKRHWLVLQGRDDLYFKDEIAVDFKPYNKSKNRTRTSITPTFSNDRKYYTPSFILPSLPSEDAQQLLEDHEKRVAQSLFQIEEILYPKPRSKQKYCGVCRNHYEDYKDHVEGEEHRLVLRRSLYQSLIKELCKKSGFGIEPQVQDIKIIDLTSQESPKSTRQTECTTPQKAIILSE